MVRYFDYRPEYRELKGEILAACRRVFESGRLVLGDEVQAFEQECSGYLEVRHAVGVNSGTDAISLALRALGVGDGDEVITVANAGVPTIAAIRATGATPRFVDVDPDTLLIDATALEGVLSARTRCVAVVHLYGQPVDLGAVIAFARRHNLRIVEDCAQAFGAKYDGRPVGGLGDIGCYSFYPTKTLGAYGDGGLCVTGDDGLAERLRMLRMYGYRDDGHAHIEGVNSRLDELQAAILRVKLRHFDQALLARDKIAERYLDGLATADCRLIGRTPKGTHVYHLFVIEVDDRDRVTAALRDRDIGFGIHYPEPVHLMQAYQFLGVHAGSLPVSERACRRVLSLPIYPGLADGDIDRVIDALIAAG